MMLVYDPSVMTKPAEKVITFILQSGLDLLKDEKALMELCHVIVKCEPKKVVPIINRAINQV